MCVELLMHLVYLSLVIYSFIDKSRLKRKRPCEEFSDDIYQNALDFTFDNIKIDKVLNEVCSNELQVKILCMSVLYILYTVYT